MLGAIFMTLSRSFTPNKRGLQPTKGHYQVSQTATSQAASTLPTADSAELTQGSTVQVRGSLWAVSHVEAAGAGRSAHRIVDLQCLDEDRMGHELRIVWEQEVGAMVAPSRVIPAELQAVGFEDPDFVGACVDAVRWGAVTSADGSAYQSPFRSGVNIEAYQLEPLRRALSAPRTNLLLADDVGLGKTIEAGLVLQELVLRHQVQTTIIVCPPSLAVKWQQEMRDRFGLSFTIVNSECLAQLRRTHGLHANPFTVFPRVIVSMAWLPTPRAQRLLRPVLRPSESDVAGYAFDMLIVDEAHHVAPAGPTRTAKGRGYAIDSQRTIRTRELAVRCEHRLFLSATPHNGYTESFTALLEMIDSRRFTRGMRPVAEDIEAVTVRRLKTDIKEKGFKARQHQPIVFTPDPSEIEHYELLRHVLERSAKNNGKRAVDGLFASLITKRFLSSPWSFAESLRNYASARDTGSIGWDQLTYDEVLSAGQNDEEEGLVSHPEATAMRQSRGADVLSGATSGEIDCLISWASAYESRPDSRLAALTQYLNATCRPDGTLWLNERVVVFTEYRDTLEWMLRHLTSQGFTEDRIAVIHGGVGTEQREFVRDAFTSPPDKDPVRVLLATDSAGEGIDLQRYCHRLVNFDIPFNPSRLEQRIGRIDRYGQQETPIIRMFQPHSAASSLFEGHMKQIGSVLAKVSTIRSDLGTANEVLTRASSQDLDKSIESDVQAIVSTTASPAGEAPTGEVRPDDGDFTVRRVLAGGSKLNADLKRLMRTYEQRKKELHVTPAASERVLRHALLLPPASAPLSEVGSEDTDAQVFEVPQWDGAWRQACAGLDTMKDPGVWRPITFDHDAAQTQHDLVHIHMGHALLQRAARSLRAKVTTVSSAMRGVTAVVSDEVDASCVVAVARVVLLGTGGVRLHEEILASGIRLQRQNLARDKSESALAVALDQQAPLATAVVLDHLVAMWNDKNSRVRERMTQRLTAGVEEAKEATLQVLSQRLHDDVERVKEIYASSRENLEVTKMDLSEESATPQLWTTEEQRQRDRDLQNVLERLNSLDANQDAELAMLRRRYANPRNEHFPVALVFVVTPEDATKWGAA